MVLQVGIRGWAWRTGVEDRGGRIPGAGREGSRLFANVER